MKKLTRFLAAIGCAVLLLVFVVMTIATMYVVYIVAIGLLFVGLVWLFSAILKAKNSHS